MWIDTHCHIHTEDDPLELARGALNSQVSTLICIGTDVISSEKSLEFASSVQPPAPGRSIEFPRIYSTIGLHPHDASRKGLAGVEGIARLAESNVASRYTRLVGIGECGLDYYYENSPKADQQEAFAAQIEIAKTYDLALVIHTRDAWEDTFAILSENPLPNRVVFHCFTGDKSIAARALDLGAFLSFSGMVTFKNTDDIREAALLTPLDRLLIETDSPFLAPAPYRGKRNVPAYVGIVGERIASLKGLTPSEFAHAVVTAAGECFSFN